MTAPVAPGRNWKDLMRYMWCRLGVDSHDAPYVCDRHVRNKTSLKVIQAALGHANLATTSRYVGLVADEMNKQLQEHALLPYSACSGSSSPMAATARTNGRLDTPAGSCYIRYLSNEPLAIYPLSLHPGTVRAVTREELHAVLDSLPLQPEHHEILGLSALQVPYSRRRPSSSVLLSVASPVT